MIFYCTLTDWYQNSSSITKQMLKLNAQNNVQNQSILSSSCALQANNTPELKGSFCWHKLREYIILYLLSICENVIYGLESVFLCKVWFSFPFCMLVLSRSIYISSKSRFQVNSRLFGIITKENNTWEFGTVTGE